MPQKLEENHEQRNTGLEEDLCWLDVSENSIETFAVFGTETSKGRCKIKNNQKTIRKFLTMFKNPAQVCVVMETGTHSL